MKTERREGDAPAPNDALHDRLGIHNDITRENGIHATKASEPIPNFKHMPIIDIATRVGDLRPPVGEHHLE